MWLKVGKLRFRNGMREKKNFEFAYIVLCMYVLKVLCIVETRRHFQWYTFYTSKELCERFFALFVFKDRGILVLSTFFFFITFTSIWAQYKCESTMFSFTHWIHFKMTMRLIHLFLKPRHFSKRRDILLLNNIFKVHESVCDGHQHLLFFFLLSVQNIKIRINIPFVKLVNGPKRHFLYDEIGLAAHYFLYITFVLFSSIFFFLVCVSHCWNISISIVCSVVELKQSFYL